MTILNFEQHLHPKEIRKGQDYFSRGRVSELTDEGSGDWTASVQGRDDYVYEVRVELDKVFVSETSCDCPVFNSKDFCKHVIATMYAIREDKGLDGDNGDSDETEIPADDAFSQLVQNIDAASLRTIIIEHGRKNEGFKTLFMSQYRNKSDDNGHTEKAPVKMRVVRDIVDAAAKKTTPVDGDLADVLLSSSSSLEEADKAMSKKRFTEARDIALRVIKEVPAYKDPLGDTAPDIITDINKGFKILLDICTMDAGSKMMGPVREEALRQLHNPAYELNDHPHHWIDFAAIISGDEEEEDQQLLKELDKMSVIAIRNCDSEAKAHIDSARRMILENEWYDDENEEDQKKIEADEKYNKEKPIADKKIAAAKAKDNFDEAKRLMLEELEKAKKYNHGFRYDSLRDDLLELMQEKSDVLGVRKMAKRFYEESGLVEYFETMKDTYIGWEWEPLGKAHVSKLEKNIPLYINGEADASLLADVYLLEYTDGDKLLGLLHQVKSLSLLNKYVENFSEGYCLNLIELYGQLLPAYAAANTDIAADRLIYTSLKTLKTLRGGKVAVKKELDKLKEQFPGRTNFGIMESRLKV